MEMCYSVAQIALTVFVLSAPTRFRMDEVQESTWIWMEERNLTSKVDRSFEQWVSSRGGAVQYFIASVLEACGCGSRLESGSDDESVLEAEAGRSIVFPDDFKAYFIKVLEEMLH